MAAAGLPSQVILPAPFPLTTSHKRLCTSLEGPYCFPVNGREAPTLLALVNSDKKGPSSLDRAARLGDTGKHVAGLQNVMNQMLAGLTATKTATFIDEDGEEVEVKVIMYSAEDDEDDDDDDEDDDEVDTDYASDEDADDATFVSSGVKPSGFKLTKSQLKSILLKAFASAKDTGSDDTTVRQSGSDSKKLSRTPSAADAAKYKENLRHLQQLLQSASDTSSEAQQTSQSPSPSHSPAKRKT